METGTVSKRQQINQTTPPKVKVSNFSWDPYIVNYRKSCPLQLLYRDAILHDC